MKVASLSLSVLAASGDICSVKDFEVDIAYKMGAQHDIGHVPASDASDCCSKCSNTTGCMAFTLADSECWLHYKAGNRITAKGAVSGSVTPVPAPTPGPIPPAPPAPSPPVTTPVQVFILLGQSNMLGEGKMLGSQDGTLEYATQTKGLYPYLLDSGSWSVRDDVRNVFIMGSGNQSFEKSTLFHNEWMTPNPTKKKTIGPELGIGYTVGDAIEAPVMMLKSCIGNRALGWDLMSPGTGRREWTDSSGKTWIQGGYHDSFDHYEKGTEEPKHNPTGWLAGIQWDGDIGRAHRILQDLDTYYPGGAKDFEVAGFFWWQGDKDSRRADWSETYEDNLVQFIKDLRTEFNAPNAKFVTASLGQTAMGAKDGGGKILDAMLAVDGKSGKYPEFEGNVAAVYTHPLSKGGSSGGHYSGNAETYMNVGEAMGAAMVALLNGDASVVV